MVNSSGLEKNYTLTDGLTDIQKSDLYSEVALIKNRRKVIFVIYMNRAVDKCPKLDPGTTGN